MEDLKTPVMTSRFDDAYLTAGCWSPTRPGVFFTSKQDGSLDVWDYLHKHHDPIFSTKVSDVGLASLKLHSSGKLAALGGMDGSLTVLELSEGTYWIIGNAHITSDFCASAVRDAKRRKECDEPDVRARKDSRGVARSAGACKKRGEISEEENRFAAERVVCSRDDE